MSPPPPSAFLQAHHGWQLAVDAHSSLAACHEDLQRGHSMLVAQRKALGDRCAALTAQVEVLEGDKANLLFGWQQVMMWGGVGAFLCIGRCVCKGLCVCLCVGVGGWVGGWGGGSLRPFKSSPLPPRTCTRTNPPHIALLALSIP